MSLFGKLWDREPKRMLKLDQLLTEMGNAHFSCGEYNGDDQEHYSALCAVADKAKQDVIDYVRELRSSPLPQSGEGAEK